MIAPDANAAFVAAMEDVLEVYQRPRNPACPVVCLDETSKQLIAETRMPIKAKPGQPARVDYEYERNGTANLFMIFAPLEGWRHVKVTDRHATIDYAHVLKELSDTHFPGATKIVLVQDNLNTHKPASLYEAFPPAKRAAWLSALNGTTRPSTEVGWTWRSPSSASCPGSASIGAFPANRHSPKKSPHGRKTETENTQKPIGSSPPPMLASNSNASIPQCERLGVLGRR